MEANSTDLQKLDFVAKSLRDGSGVGTVRSVFTGLAAFMLFLAFISGAPSRETNLVRAMAAVAVIAVLVAWLKPRFASYGWAAMFLMMAVGALLSNDYSRTVLGWISRLYIVTFLLWIGFSYAKKAWAATIIQRDRWKGERETVQKWIATLSTVDPSPQVLKFISESFRNGHFAYRMLNTGFCWVIGKFKKGNFRAMIECRVHSLNAIRQIDIGRGQIEISIEGKRISDVITTAAMQARLSSALPSNIASTHNS